MCRDLVFIDVCCAVPVVARLTRLSCVSDGREVLYWVGGVKSVVFHTSLSYVCMIFYRLDYYLTECLGECYVLSTPFIDTICRRVLIYAKRNQEDRQESTVPQELNSDFRYGVGGPPSERVKYEF